MGKLKYWFAAVAVLWCACVWPTSNLDEYGQAALDATIEAWEETPGLGALGGCNLDTFRVEWWAGREFSSRCPGATTNDTAACLYYLPSSWRELETPVAMLRKLHGKKQSQIDSTGGPVSHELIHHLAHCTGRPRWQWHEDSELWSAAGGDASVQARAREKLRAVLGTLDLDTEATAE